MKAAWQAILAGDYTERDRLCERTRRLMPAEHVANAVERVLSVDFYVTARGTAIPTPLLAKAGLNIH